MNKIYKAAGLSLPMANISIIVPAYNEEKSIANTINRIKLASKKISHNTNILVIDDGSTDKTGVILGKINGINIIRNKSNSGYGASLKSGIRNSKADYILIVDADGTYPIELIPKIVSKIKENDMVVGARTGTNVSIPFFRKPAKWILKHFAQYLTKTKIPDLNSGFRLFKKEIATKYLNLFPDGFSFTTTLTMICLTNGYKIEYIPINYYERKGSSTISPIMDFFGFINLIFRLTIFFKPLNVFIPISIIIFVAGVLKLVRDFLLLNEFGLGGSILILTSIQIAFLGILAELIIKRTSV